VASQASVSQDFARQVVQWQARHGRNSLPWQATRDPYRVWLSEIMLQQTQVVTVLGYFERFLHRFPDVRALAQGSLDEVLGLWSGLGYYSRARNLHRCAQKVMEQHGGAFPRSAAQLHTLPGIGRSTAAAIASLCFEERVPILDANVRRVLTRVLGFAHDLAQASAERALWEQAASLVPAQAADMPRYTQGMMDLGATLCLPRKPLCEQCPVAQGCRARQAGEPERYPVKTRKLRRTSQSLWLLLAHTPQSDVLLCKRPTPGVWAGLYCLPLFDTEEAMLKSLPASVHGSLQPAQVFTHVLTHKDLHLHPWTLALSGANEQALKALQGQWFAAADWPALGLPAPVRKLLEQQALTAH
jgi:A/G-specific adenine glycosylase